MTAQQAILRAACQMNGQKPAAAAEIHVARIVEEIAHQLEDELDAGIPSEVRNTDDFVECSYFINEAARGIMSRFKVEIASDQHNLDFVYNRVICAVGRVMRTTTNWE